MKELGFECLKSDADNFLYWKKGMNIVVAVVYVDDTLFCGPTRAIVNEIKGLIPNFTWEWISMRLLGAVSLPSLAQIVLPDSANDDSLEVDYGDLILLSSTS